MSETAPQKYTAEEWNHIRKRFFNSILNEAEIAKLGQNVGISWPFQGTGETPAKYMEFDFEELQSVPGLVGKMSRVKTLMNILRETLAFDDPFGDMVNTFDTESQEDGTFERLLAIFEIPASYPVEFIHFSEETKELLKNEGVSTLIECIRLGQRIQRTAAISDDLKSFLNSLTHKDEAGIAKHVPYRRGERGLHLAEAIGLICEDLSETTQLQLMEQGGVDLSDEEALQLSSADELQIETSIKNALEGVAKLAEWFTAESADLVTVFSTECAPERYFITINEPRRERIAAQLAKLKFAPREEKKSGFLGRIFGR